MPGKRLISLAVMIFIIYAVASDKYTQSKIREFIKSNQTNLQPTKEPDNSGTFANLSVHTSQNDSVVGNFVAKMLNNALNTPEGQQVAKKIINDLPEKFSIPQEFKEMSIQEEKIGNGNDIIECGQKISINYALLSSDGKIIEKHLDIDHPFDITVGANDIISAIDLVVLGMKTGGSKKVTLSPYFIEHDINLRKKLNGYNGFLTLLINVIKTSNLPTSSTKLRVFTENVGQDSPAKCGDTINIHYKILRLDGTELFNSTKLYPNAVAIKIGSNQVPFALSKAIEYMNIGSERVVIVPPELMQNIDSKPVIDFFPSELKLPKEIIMLEIVRI